jgi:hypothetical protein
MIDLLSLGIAHGLMLIAAWRLFGRVDLDQDEGVTRRTPWGRRPDA